MLRGEPSVVAVTMPDDILEAITGDERHLEMFKELDYASHMCVPLKARGRVLGALTLVSAGSGRRFGGSDLALAEEFGRRAALGDRQRAAVLGARPRRPGAAIEPSATVVARDPGGLRNARAIKPRAKATRSAATSTTCSRSTSSAWWFAIGDVSGKGPEAAAIAGLARHTLRALALQERSPQRLLTTLHEILLIGESHGEFCTVCCALLQTSAKGARLSIACGGHPPPIIRRADGTIEIASASGPLLGMPVELAFVEQSLDLAPGDLFVLYTDGVTEAHRRNQELFGQERLIDVIRQAPAEVDAVADAILAAVSCVRSRRAPRRRRGRRGPDRRVSHPCGAPGTGDRDWPTLVVA